MKLIFLLAYSLLGISALEGIEITFPNNAQDLPIQPNLLQHIPIDWSKHKAIKELLIHKKEFKALVSTIGPKELQTFANIKNSVKFSLHWTVESLLVPFSAMEYARMASVELYTREMKEIDSDVHILEALDKYVNAAKAHSDYFDSIAQRIVDNEEIIEEDFREHWLNLYDAAEIRLLQLELSLPLTIDTILRYSQVYLEVLKQSDLPYSHEMKVFISIMRELKLKTDEVKQLARYPHLAPVASRYKSRIHVLKVELLRIAKMHRRDSERMLS